MPRPSRLTVVVPAAGRGLRMAGAQAGAPKPLLEVGRRPMIVEVLEAARLWFGVEGVDYRVVTGRDGGRLGRFLRRYYAADPLGRRLSLRRQRRADGPLDAVLAAGKVSGPLVIWLSDTLLLGRLPALTLDAVYAAPVRAPLSRWCLAETGRGSRLARLVDKPARYPRSTGRALIGLYALSDGALFRRQALEAVSARERQGGEYQLSSALLRYHARRPLSVAPAPGWQDAGQPETFLAAKERLLDRLPAHRVELRGTTAVKRSRAGKTALRRELRWYARTARENPAAAASLPQAALRGGALVLPYRDWPRLADWYLYRSLYASRHAEDTFAGFLRLVDGRLHRPRPAPADAAVRTERMLAGKALERLAAFRGGGLLGAAPVTLNGRVLTPWTRLRPKLLALVGASAAPGSGDWSTIHGDLVFSNVLADGQGRFFLIDPRGSYGGVDGVEGDRYYDYAKVFQCLEHRYDSVKAGEFSLARRGRSFELRFPLAGAAGRASWAARFEAYRRARGVDDRRLRLFTASLLLSLLPLHDDRRQMTAVCLQALAALDAL